MNRTNMRPQDVVILLKLMTRPSKHWTQVELARQLFLSQSEISESLARSSYSGLLLPKRQVQARLLFNFLVHGLPYVFPQQLGPVQRGIATSHSAEPLKTDIVSEEAYVWPYAKGDTRGKSVQPLYVGVVQAVDLDADLYQMLALVDALRVGRVREKNLAATHLEKLLL